MRTVAPEAEIGIKRAARRQPGNRKRTVFDRRDDIVKFLAVAEAGKIGAAAERLAIAQPALTRTIARLEARFGARLFERLPTGVRPTALGETAAELARGPLREIDAGAEKFDAVIRGRTGSYWITASSMWMEAVLAPAVDAFSARLPGIELTLRTAPRRPRRGRLPPRGPVPGRRSNRAASRSAAVWMRIGKGPGSKTGSGAGRTACPATPPDRPRHAGETATPGSCHRSPSPPVSAPGASLPGPGFALRGTGPARLPDITSVAGQHHSTPPTIRVVPRYPPGASIRTGPSQTTFPGPEAPP